MDGYQQLIDLIWLESLQMRFAHWLLTEVLVLTTLVQIIAATIGLALGYGISVVINKQLRRRITRLKMT